MTRLADPAQAAKLALKAPAQQIATLDSEISELDTQLKDLVAATACEKSREIAANHSMDDTAEHHLVGTVNLRFIYLGMIGDIARHAGHADILVEQIRAENRAGMMGRCGGRPGGVR
ncbi:MAG: DUF664 domain-containing protein [Sciscionella sp.]